NNTVWEAEPCTLCSCLGDIVSCQHKQCHNPECDFQRGERLKIAPNRCCPECGTSSGSCLYEGEVVGHNSQWRPEPCTECYCRAGTVHCSNTSCPRTQCSSEEVLQRIPGQCCPDCIRPGRSCTYRGITYRHSQEWNPLKCAKCICNNGVVRCFVVDCPPLICKQGEVAVVPEGKCCPECVGSSCQVDAQVYPDGASWRLDTCTYCQCQSGTVTCTQERCADDLPCAMGERNHKNAPCIVDGERWFSGDLWNVSACEFCMCRRGRMECHSAQCDRIECSSGESLIKREGRCCPECAGPSGLCYFEDDIYRDGQSWDVDDCSICSCDQGVIDCFISDCPPCPVGTVAILDEGRCCPECVTVQCPPECLSCDEVGCTSCRQHHLLQDGRCMDGCSVGHFQASDLRCLVNHSMFIHVAFLQLAMRLVLLAQLVLSTTVLHVYQVCCSSGASVSINAGQDISTLMGTVLNVISVVNSALVRESRTVCPVPTLLTSLKINVAWMSVEIIFTSERPIVMHVTLRASVVTPTAHIVPVVEGQRCSRMADVYPVALPVSFMHHSGIVKIINIANL
ncbi:putative extracellular matrix protein FRAS1-like, partial [Apostichopus japonicus]